MSAFIAQTNFLQTERSTNLMVYRTEEINMVAHNSTGVMRQISIKILTLTGYFKAWFLSHAHHSEYSSHSSTF